MALFSANLLGNWHMMVGIDLHKTWPPGSLSPLPLPTPHACFMVLNGWGNHASMTSKVKADYHSVIQKNSDIGRFIPHVQANLLLPFIISSSSSKSEIGVNSVIAEGRPVAVACAKIMNLNINCNSSKITCTGLVIAMPITAEAGLTLADILSYAARLVFNSAFKKASSFLKKGAKKNNAMDKVYEGLFKKLKVPILTNAVRPMLAQKGRSDLIKFTEFLEKKAKAKLEEKVKELSFKHPIGWGDRFKLLDDAAEKSSDYVHDAVYNFFSEDTEVLSSDRDA